MIISIIPILGGVGCILRMETESYVVCSFSCFVFFLSCSGVYYVDGNGKVCDLFIFGFIFYDFIFCIVCLGLRNVLGYLFQSLKIFFSNNSKKIFDLD